MYLNENILAFDVVGTLIYMAIMMAISYGIQRLIQKKPKSIHHEPNTFDVPEIEEGGNLTVVFGTCWVENPVIGWWGATDSETAKMRIDDSGGQYVYFYKYYHGALHVICQGRCDGILQIKVGENIVWPDQTNKFELSADGETSAVIDLPNLYGGITTYHGSYSLGGGLTGTVDLCYGDTTQQVNSYLASVLGSYTSANRGLTTSVLRQVYVGTEPYVQPWRYMVKRILHLSVGDTQWYAEKAAIRTYEINPIHVLRECYTDTEWGLKLPTSRFNDTIWMAAADALYEEGFGICAKWEGNQPLEEFISSILDCIDAVIYEDHNTGEFVIKLIRDDYDSDLLDEYSNTAGIVNIDGFSRGALKKTPNITYLKYWNMYDNLPVMTPSINTGMMSLQNEILITNEVNYTMIVNPDLAGQVASREQAQMSMFPAVMKIYGNRTMSSLNPGDCIKISYAPLGIISMIVRIVTVDYGTLDNGICSFEAIEDIFGLKESLYKLSSIFALGEAPSVETSDPDDIANYILMETPYYELVRARTDAIVSLYDNDEGYLTAGASPQDTLFYNYDLMLRDSPTSDFYLSGTNDFTPSGTIKSDIPMNAANIEVVLDNVYNLEGVVINTYAVIGSEIFKVKEKYIISPDITNEIGCIYDASSYTDVYGDALYGPKNAFNDSTASMWQPTSGSDEWVSCQFTEAKVIKNVRIKPYTAVSPINQMNVKYFKVQASNNGSSWTTIDVKQWIGYCKEWTGDGGHDTEMDLQEGVSEWVEIILDNITAYTYWRIYVVENWGGWTLGPEIVIPEIEMKEETDYKVVLARGCLDTVPAEHTTDDRIWFLGSVSHLANTEYTVADEPGVKFLPRTGEGILDESDATAHNADAFNSRMIRPYPPSNFKINSVSYPSSFTGQPTLTWLHRNRTSPTTYIVEQSATGITPEAGTTYTLKIYDQSNNLVRTVTGISGLTYTYSWEDEMADCGLNSGDPLNTQLRFVLNSVRDGYDSWQSIDITVQRV